MDWKTGMREIVEECINTIESEHVDAWGHEKDDETDLDLEFPASARKVVIINGEKHVLDCLFTLDGELPCLLKYAETDSQFEMPKQSRWIYDMMLEGIF